MPTLHFAVKTDLVLSGSQHSVAETLSAPAAVELDHYGDSPNVKCFYLHAWIGGGSDAYSITPMKADGTADVKLNMQDGDVNTFKLEFNYTCPSTSGDRVHHHSSNKILVTDLMAHLEGDSKCQHWFMQNNVVQNGAVCKFTNLSTNIEEIKKLKLRPSALLKQEAINTKLLKMGNDLKGKLSTLNISAANAGPEFVNGFTMLPMEGALTNYGLLGFQFQCVDSAVPLQMIMYNGYKTLDSTGLSLASLASMTDSSLVSNFGTQLVVRPTCCAFTSPYSPDVTMNAAGKVVADTESIDRSFSAMSLHAQVCFLFSNHVSTGWGLTMHKKLTTVYVPSAMIAICRKSGRGAGKRGDILNF